MTTPPHTVDSAPARLFTAWPIGQIPTQLLDKIGWFNRVLVSLYNSMNERRREIAILRALGARRATVFSAIVLEAVAITALGTLGGFAVYTAITSGVAGIIRAETGVVLNPLSFSPAMLWAPGLMLALGALAGVVPAWKAYRTSVADHPAPVS